MIVPLPRELREGDVGRDVLMVKRAIARAGYRRWGFGFTKKFGPSLTTNVKQLQRATGLKVDGVYGLATHKKLASYFDAYSVRVMVKLAAIPVEVQQALVSYNDRDQVGYTQSASRMMIVREKIRDLIAWFKKGRTLWEDCSSIVTGFYFIGRHPDPNGYRTPQYPGYGFTGTLSVHGVRVALPEPGDLGFYGAYPYNHVTICVGLKKGRPVVVSHGSSVGPLLLDYAYRSDFSHWRRYP